MPVTRFEVIGIQKGHPESIARPQLAPLTNIGPRARRLLGEAANTNGLGFLGTAIAVSAATWIAHGLAGFGWQASLTGAVILAPSVASILVATSIPETLDDGFARLVSVNPIQAAGIPMARLLVGLLTLIVPAMGTVTSYLVVHPEIVAVEVMTTASLSVVATVALASLVGVTVRRPLSAAGVWSAFLAISAAMAYVYMFSPPSSELGLRLLHITPLLLSAEALALVPNPWTSSLQLPLLLIAAGTTLAAYVAARSWEPEEPRPTPLVTAWMIATGALIAPLMWMTSRL